MRAPPQYERALALLAGPAAAGADFMQIAAQALALGLGCRCAGIVSRDADGSTVSTLAWYLDGTLQPSVTYALAGTPCAHVYEPSPPPWHVLIPDKVHERFPNDDMLADLGVVSYCAEAFADNLQRPVGHVFVMDDEPMTEDMHELSFFRLVAQRAGAEFNRAQAELELRLSEQRLMDFAATAADWFWETDAAGRFTYHSGAEPHFAASHVLGKTRWELAGADPASDVGFTSHLEDLKARRPFRNFSYSVDRRGKQLRFSVSGVPIVGPDGAFAGYRGTAQDVTSQWEAQVRLAFAAERLEKFLRLARRLTSSIVIETEGLEAAVRELTETVARELDIERVSLWIALPGGLTHRCLDRYLAGQNLHESGAIIPGPTPSAGRGTAVVAIDDILEDPGSAHIRERYLLPHGIRSLLEADIWRQGRLVGSLIFAHCGEPRSWTREERVFAGFLAQYAGRLIEADARISVERRLYESEAFHRALIENAHDDLSVVGRDGIVRFHSSSSLYQRRRGDTGIVGKKLLDLVHPDDRQRAEALLAGGVGPVLLRFPDAGIGWMSFELNARDMYGDPVVQGLVLTWRDVTERLANLEALRAAKEEAELANRSKSAFLANISHELRTPLNAVLGFSEIIRDELLGAIPIRNYVEYAHDIHESGQLLLNVINDILDLSKIEAGRQEAVTTEVDVGQAVATCIRLLERSARSANVSLLTFCPADLPWLLADERHLKQMLINLLSNAIKFTDDGGEASVSAHRDAGGGISIEVADTGIGMSAEDLRIALSPFGQVDNSLTKRFDGTGLGLPLTKALAELNGGRMEIDSAPQRGTVVRLCFPRERTIVPGSQLERPLFRAM